MTTISEVVEERVVAELRARKVKLWEPPYLFLDANDEQISKTHRGRPNHEAMEKLANDLLSSIPGCSKEDILNALLSKQVHALEKLEKKQNAKTTTTESTSSVIFNLHVIVMGLESDIVPPPQDSSNMGVVESWAKHVEFLPKSIKLQEVNPKLTVCKFVRNLKSLLNVVTSSVRLMHKGKVVPTNDANEERLVQALLTDFKSWKSTIKATLYCQVQVSQTSAIAQPRLSQEQALIQSIRNAATKLSGSANVEVTDQNGNHVPMAPSDRHAFLTALGLHRLGRGRMERGNGSYDSALTLLLQADQEWTNVSDRWRNRVDNYGLLQMDIAWTYLHLEQLERLPDATHRLQVAETTLLKQVHSNFVTLAFTMAEMGEPVPPVSAIFARLFLLQGVAYRYCSNSSNNNNNKAKDKLDWAWQVCASLRKAATPEAVSSLEEIMTGITKSQAISALRRCNGNRNQAVELLQQDKDNAIQQHKKRELQRELGLCQNTMDYVDTDALSKLMSMLGVSSPTAVAAMPPQDDLYQVAVGLLRLGNNDLTRAIDIYQDVDRGSDAVMQQVSALDASLASQGLATPPNSKKRPRIAVDDVALATLVSMGVEERLAKKALRASRNSLDMSLLWLASKDDEHNDVKHIEIEDDDVDGESHGEVDGSALSDEEEQDDALDEKQLEIQEAMDLLQRELGVALQDYDLEREYLGSSLDEEWAFLQKFAAGPMVKNEE